ncbi:MAG: hypothetical protein CM15mV122_100 [uncultured marine virus]|nr:MAG: hypothetical protein CM15mV122_100 [uncultured marine virus]
MGFSAETPPLFSDFVIARVRGSNSASIWSGSEEGNFYGHSLAGADSDVVDFQVFIPLQRR